MQSRKLVHQKVLVCVCKTCQATSERIYIANDKVEKD